MNLDFFNSIAHDVKSHSFMQQFIDELTEYLNNIKENITERQIRQDLTDFLSTDELVSKYKISYTFLGDFYEKRNDILKEYSNNKKFYYIAWNNNIDDKYDEKNIYEINEYSNGNMVSTFHLSGKDLPQIVQEGMILEKIGDKYIVDTTLSNNISQKLQEASQEIVDLQENNTKQYRIENDLYVVVERGANSAYLQNVNNNIVFEETLFSDDLFNSLHNDAVVSFKDGKYIYEDEITREWMDSFISTNEHTEVLQELMNEPNFSKIDFANTTFSIISRDDNYTILSYGENHQDTLKVSNKLVDYWADDNSILYYDKDDNFFYKRV